MNLKEAKTAFDTYSTWLGEGLQPVEKDEAQCRTEVCLTCPKNQHDLLDEIIKGVFTNIVRRQIMLRNSMNLHVEGEENLHICGVCHCVLELLVWVPTKTIKETKSKELLEETPDFCWQREALK